MKMHYSEITYLLLINNLKLPCLNQLSDVFLMSARVLRRDSYSLHTIPPLTASLSSYFRNWNMNNWKIVALFTLRVICMKRSLSIHCSSFQFLCLSVDHRKKQSRQPRRIGGSWHAATTLFQCSLVASFALFEPCGVKVGHKVTLYGDLSWIH